MHISARMRTPPADNFDNIDLDTPLIPVEIWKDFGDQPRVRVEKQGRQIAADGKTTTMLMQSGVGAVATRFDGLAEGCFQTLAPLLDPDALFERELEIAKKADAEVTVDTKPGTDGRLKTVLTIRARAQGDFSESDFRKNTSVFESNNTHIYTFDAETYRFEGLQVYVRTGQDEILVLETTHIEYDMPLEASLFHLDVPESVVWLDPNGEPVSTRDTSRMQPDEVAREFLGALSKSDWERARVFAGAAVDMPKLREYVGGLEIISIGKPFKSGEYPGWFVPYEIKLKSGEVKKWNLAVRNDTSDGQWKWDGGL